MSSSDSGNFTSSTSIFHGEVSNLQAETAACFDILTLKRIRFFTLWYGIPFRPIYQRCR